MPAASAGEITMLLRAWSQGDIGARDRVMSLVYADLRRLAGARLRAGASPTLNPSDLVHEAFIRLLDQQARWAGRAHFLAVAAMTIRRVLVDHARARRAGKRGGEAVRVDLTDVEADSGPPIVDLIALDEGLQELAAMDARQAQVVEMRYFGGMSFEEIAGVLGTSVATAKRDWRSARLWLRWRLGGGATRSPGAP